MSYRPVPKTYRQIHLLLKETRGPARDYDCVSCGKPAAEWAYQYEGEQELRDENGHWAHSLNPDDYLPMCLFCHRQLDMERDPSMAELRRQGGSRGAVRSGPTLEAISRKRRVCIECDKESNVAGINNHQRSSGHAGYRDLPTTNLTLTASRD